MIQTQHLYSHQQQYSQHESTWQHAGPQQGMNHGSQQAQAQAAAAAVAAAQQQHYTRIAMNQNHNSSHTQAGNRQSSGDNAQNNMGASLMNDRGSPGQDDENRKVLQWVSELMDPNRREGALMELSKKREQVPELALVLWHSFGVMTSLLQEIISVYPLLNPSQLTAAASNRVCNALALLQCVASHNETRGLFLTGKSALLYRSVFDANEIYSAHSTVPLSFPQHYFQVASFRISPPYIVGCHWSLGQE